MNIKELNNKIVIFQTDDVVQLVCSMAWPC